MPVSNFEVEALTINGAVYVVSGVADPHLAGYTAPIGSVYLRTNGETWKKIGAGDTQWAVDTGGGGGGIDDDSMYQLITRSIIVTDSYIVEVDVGAVSFNHYYVDGVICHLDAPNYYSHDVSIKNLSGNELLVKPSFGRIDGKKELYLSAKFAALTLKPLHDDWVITSYVEGVKHHEKENHCCHHSHD